MAFGKKKGIDFDRIESELIDPALSHFSITGRTTGEILEAGNIRTDMFQQLLVPRQIARPNTGARGTDYKRFGIDFVQGPIRDFIGAHQIVRIAGRIAPRINRLPRNLIDIALELRLVLLD